MALESLHYLVLVLAVTRTLASRTLAPHTLATVLNKGDLQKAISSIC